MGAESEDELGLLVLGLIPRLTTLARLRLPSRLQSKLDAEDLVQSMVASWFKDRGRSQAGEARNEKELLALFIFRLKQKLADRIRYFNSEKRSLSREASISSFNRENGLGASWEPAARDGREIPEIEEEINRILNDLPEQHRQIVILRDLEGWSEVQIGEELKLSRFAVHRRYAMAMEKLRNTIGGVDPHQKTR
jgi:RNA polymerase sigma factor (sigma-70 family)